jgi:hypothetical protein
VEKKLGIRNCEKCGTKVIPTREERCPACQKKFEPPLESEPAHNTQPGERTSWTPFLVLVGLVTLAGLMGRRKQRHAHLKLVA